MNYVEKFMDGVQSYLNVNSATFSGAVDIIVVPQEDGSLACTSWHVRFGKLQLLNTSEKKIQIEVNDGIVKGMKMRLGRAGEAYFVRETHELPPPEFRASIDPEHGLSDDESESMEPRAAADDWADPRDEKQRQGDAAVGEEMDWGASHALAVANRTSIDEGHRNSLDVVRAIDGDTKISIGIKASSSAQAVITGKGSSAASKVSPSSSQPALGPSGASSSRGNGTDASSTDATAAEGARRSPPLPSRRSQDGLDPSDDAAAAAQGERLNTSDPSLPISSSPSPSPQNSSFMPTEPVPKKASTSKKESKSKSWGLSLFGFLGPKKDQDAEQSEDTTSHGHASTAIEPLSATTKPQAAKSLTRSAEYDTTGNGLERSSSFRVDKLGLSGDEIHYQGEHNNREGAIQSSSLPNNWGPSPLVSLGTSSGRSGYKSPSDEGYTSGRDDRSDGGRSYDEERSRAAEDGSGVIYVGKRKARSSSITSATLVASGSQRAIQTVSPPPHATGTISPSLDQAGAHASGTATPPLQPAPSGATRSSFTSSDHRRSKSAERPMSGTTATTSTQSISSAVSVGSAASEDDDDEEYHDMVFEMDEEAYQAANPAGGLVGGVGGGFVSAVGAGGWSSGVSLVPGQQQQLHLAVVDGGLENTSSEMLGGGNGSVGGSSIGNGAPLQGGASGGIINASTNNSGGASSNPARHLVAPATACPVVEISRCGFAAVANHDADPSAAQDAFAAAKISWQAMNDEPNLLFAPEVVFRIAGLYLPFSAAAPILFSFAAFNTPLSAQSVGKLVSQAKSARQQASSKSWGRWFGFGNKSDLQGSAAAGSGAGAAFSSSSTSAAAPSGVASPPTPNKANTADKRGGASAAHGSSGLGGLHTQGGANSSAVGQGALGTQADRGHHADSEEALYVNASGVTSPRTVRTLGSKSKHGTGVNVTGGQGNGGTKTIEVEISDYSNVQGPSGPASGATSASVTPSPSNLAVSGQTPTYYVRSLKPTSEQLKSLNLKPGPNQVIFRVNSRLQGVQQVASTVYLWDRDSKVVISDIDGTITKSDVLGQIFPVFGKDWSHSGVAALFQSIKANGYEILYLTARAIGAAKLTKGFLTTLQQDSVHLPDGPVFMSPDRLLHSLNREVILRKPEQFKIHCLSEIKELFLGAGAPTKDSGPFYAGFGNRDTDALSYVAVGIPVGKTFTINPSGEITGHVKSIQRTYTKIHELVEQMFPPHQKSDKKKQSRKEHLEQWNDFQYWDSRPAGMSLEDIEKELLN